MQPDDNAQSIFLRPIFPRLIFGMNRQSLSAPVISLLLLNYNGAWWLGRCLGSICQQTSVKGKTLLNTCGLGTQEMDYIMNNTPFKQNKIAPGSWVPVRPPGTLLADQPDFALILAWNFAPEIIRRETEYQKRGGRFILPIPEPRFVDSAS
jgi:hypothetical protein